MGFVEVIFGALFYVLGFAALGTVLVAPLLMYIALAFGAGWFARRWGRIAAFGVAAALLSPLILIPALRWQHRITTYRAEAQTIQQRIAATPRLIRAQDPPKAILVRDYAFSGLDIVRPGCFESLYFKEREAIWKWDSKRGSVPSSLPDRYLEFDTVDSNRSDFGKRTKTGSRGPYELWLVEGKQRRLVDVFFIADDGRSIRHPLPPLIGPFPAHLDQTKRSTALLGFLLRATGQCPQAG